MYFKKQLSLFFSLIYVSHLALAHTGGLDTGDAGQHPNYNVSGDNGKNGSDGVSYSGSASQSFFGSGNNGRHGGHATNPTAGENAGLIDLNLQMYQGYYVINGYLQYPNGQRQQVNSLQVSLASHGSLALLAKGGDGGRGGIGGDGEDGGMGYRGQDATQSSNGTNGGPGGDGGDSGAGTSGANSGRGGQVIVNLKESDTALLMLVETNVRGGHGGRAGRHGRPGSGGSGGPGGSSHSWTETEYYTDTETTSSTDSEGNTTYSTNTVTRSRNNYYSNPGGSSGWSGSSGRSQTGLLHDGQSMPDGQYLIRVADENGQIHEYTQRYDLQLLSYDYIPHDNDGILEPGELVFVKNLKIRNTGGMPTPKNTKVRIFLRNGDYSVAQSVELTIPKSLAAGEEFIFNQQNLEFKIQNNLIGRIGEERLVWNDKIRPLAEMTEVNREFQNFSHDQAIQITYPIEIESVMANRSLAAGESSKILIKVKNISKKDFGSDSELKRQLELAIKRDAGDLASGQLQITNLDGQPWSIEDGLLKAISHLKAGQSAVIEGVVTVNKNAEAYRSLGLGTTLRIGTPDGDKTTTDIQKRDISFRVSQTYTVDSESEFLLVVNNETDRESIQSFKRLASSMGKKVNIWDVSYYGELALTKMLGSGSSLSQDFANKTIVVLNNKFKTNDGTMRAQKLVAIKELVLTAAQQGVNVLFVGGKASELGSGIEMQPVDGTEKEIQIAKKTLFRKASEKDLVKSAQAELAKLRMQDPTSQYQIIHSFNPELLKQSRFGVFKTWNLGQLEIIKSINANNGQLIALSGVGEKGTLSESEINSREMQLALYMAMSLEKRIETVNTIVHHEHLDLEMATQAQLMIESILLDLAEEQSTARDHFFNLHFGRLEMQKRLPKLMIVVKALEKLNFKSEDKSVQRLWIELTIGIKEMAKSKYKWWEKLIPFAANPDYTNEVLRLVNKLESKLFATAPWYRQAKAENQEWTRSEIKEITVEAKNKPVQQVEGVDKISSAVKSSGIISAEKAGPAYAERKAGRGFVRGNVSSLQSAHDQLSLGQVQNNKVNMSQPAAGGANAGSGKMTCEGLFEATNIGKGAADRTW